jgi:hypothetical protein
MIEPQVEPRNGSAGRARTARQRRRAHPLLGAFPLAVMTLATFLVVFSVMTARLKASGTTARPAGAATALLVPRSGGNGVRTRASGGANATAIASPVPASEAIAATNPAIVTRSSGTAGAPGATGDD